MTGLPTVPVHDLKIHPRDRELIAATHGRSIWIVDIAPLEEMNNGVIARATNFFTPKTAYEYSQANTQNFTGQKTFLVPNPPYGAELVYRLTSGASRDSARIVVTNIRGDTVRTLTGPGGAGLHRAYWDLRMRPRPLGPTALRELLGRYIDVGFSKFVVRPAETPASWEDELQELADDVLSMQR